MSWQDIVNGAYELLGGAAIFHHCWTLHRDKQVKGVSVLATVFFTTWGYWNLYYYPHLNQWVSFAGGIAIVIANTLWIAMMFYYLRADYKKHEAINARYEAMQAEEQAERDAWMNEEEAKFFARQTWSPRHDDTDPYCNCAACR